MAKSFTTTDGVIKIPSIVAKYTVSSNPSNLATTGVLMLVGEADAGPDFTLEDDLEETNSFGPTQYADVAAKYKSGPLVDAFKAAVAASADDGIVGSFASAILVKTNASSKASGSLPAIGGGTYAVLADRGYGKAGNQIAFQTSAATSEVLPTTGSFTYIPPVGAPDYRIRVNGGAALGTSVSANTSPAAFQALIDGLAGVSASGGGNRGMLASAGGRTASIDANPASAGANVVLVTVSSAWDVTPVVGDTFIIPSSAPALLRDPSGGATDENVGAYVITAVSATTLTATKLSDAGRSGAVAGTITPPADTAAPVALVAATDLQAFQPVTISLEAGAVLAGRGKSLEIASLTSGTDLLTRTAYVLGTTTPVSWLSTSSTPALLSSGTEYSVSLHVTRASDLVDETLEAGGEIALMLGYTGTTGTVTITDTALTTSVTGGSGGNLSIDLADFSTLQDLAAYINSQTGYSCSVGTGALGLLPPAALDDVSAAGICSQFGAKNGRLKVDAYRFFRAVSDDSATVQLGTTTVVQVATGLPDAMSAVSFMTGGTKGSTSNANVSAAFEALESVQGNFLVPLFSRDAASDILDGLTDSGSTYDIASIHAAAKSHVLAMSQLKAARNRQALLSIAADFTTVKTTGANLASFRTYLTFLDHKLADSSGTLTAMLPWAAATQAAAMQAAGFYRSIEGKLVNTSGITCRAGDFKPKNDGQVEQALDAGLLLARAEETGGFAWVSDQSTYGKDNNFVFNSLQAVYAADTVAMTLRKRLQRAVRGQAQVDVTATVAKAFCEGILADLLRLKLIAPSEGGEKGYRNLTVRIVGNVIYVSVEIFLTTAIDFGEISIQVSPVTQAA